MMGESISLPHTRGCWLGTAEQTACKSLFEDSQQVTPIISFLLTKTTHTDAGPGVDFLASVLQRIMMHFRYHIADL